MVPTYYDLEPAYKDDAYGPVIIRVKSSVSGGTYLDFSDCSEICLQARNKKNKAIVLEWRYSAGQISILDNFYISLHRKTHSEMAMPAGEYIYDLQVTLSGYKTTYMSGKIKVFEDVTRF